MSFEAGFLLAYANGLLLAALGLHRLGRINPSPWRSRVLAGYRKVHAEIDSTERTAPAAPEDADPTGDGSPRSWPHAEQPRLHTGIALVAATAALALVIAGVWRHHHGLELVLLAATGGAAGGALARLTRALTPGHPSVGRSG